MTAIPRMVYQKIVERRFLNAWHIADLGWRVLRYEVAKCVKIESIEVLGRCQVIYRLGRGL